jgi:ADP-ribosyltransferase exoenzyme
MSIPFSLSQAIKSSTGLNMTIYALETGSEPLSGPNNRRMLGRINNLSETDRISLAEWSIIKRKWEVLSHLLQYKSIQIPIGELFDKYEYSRAQYANFVKNDPDQEMPPEYVFLADDVIMFRLFYPDPEEIPSEVIDKAKKENAKEILNYASVHLLITNPNQLAVCQQGVLVPIKLMTETVSIPIRSLFSKAEDLITKGLSKKNIELKRITTETSSIGLGINSFLEKYRAIPDNWQFFDNNQRALEQLSAREIALLAGYTYTGDRLVNLYLRDSPEFDNYVAEALVQPQKKKLVPIHYQLVDRLKLDNTPEAVRSWLETAGKDDPDFHLIIRECVGTYIDELTTLFSKAPPLGKDISVFRGTKTFYYKSEGSNYFVNNDFVSTSLSPEKAINFTEGDCCFTQFDLKADIKAFFLEPVTQVQDEIEILLPPGHKFIMTKSRIKRYQPFPNFAGYRYPKALCQSGRELRYTVMQAV